MDILDDPRKSVDVSCDYIDHCLEKKYEFVEETCLTEKHSNCFSYQAMERLKNGSITDRP